MAAEYEMIRVPKEPWSQLAPSIPGSNNFRGQQIFRVLQKHWRSSLLFAIAFLAALVVVTFLMKDTYEARARIEIEPPQGPTSFTLRETSNASGNEQDYLQTQIEILKSDELATAVIQKLHLDQNGEFVRKSKQPQWWTTAISREIALSSLRNRLTVEQIRNSRLAEVTFSSRSPELAAQVINTLVMLYLERTYRAKYEATMKAAESLSPEMEEFRQRVEKANQAIVDFQNANGIVELSDGDHAQASTNNGQNPVTQRIGELNRELTQAQTDRIRQEAYLQMIQAGSADSLPQMRDNPVLQDITKRFVESRAQLTQALAVFGQNNTSVKKLQNQVGELEAQLIAERRRVVEQVKTGYQAALARERLLTQALTEMKASVERMNKNMLQYNEMKKRAQAMSDLYMAVDTRITEAALSGSLNSSNIRVVDSAHVPLKPAKPKRLQIISLGTVFAVLAGVALAFIKETFDENIYTPEDIRAWTALPSLAMFPVIASLNSHKSQLLPKASKLIGNHNDKLRNAPRLRFFSERPCSEEAEAVRSLVASIRMPNGPNANPVRIVLLVSPLPNEGKTTVAVNLAMALAQHGKTCLVDADLRNPVMGRIFGLPLHPGLADVLRGSSLLEDALRATSVTNLTILPVGSVPPDPGKLVSSQGMRELLRELRERFDQVVIDSSPMIPYADARWLSAQSDGVVLVARCGLTKQRALARITELLTYIHAPVLGVALNGVDLNSGYYGYEYKHQRCDNELVETEPYESMSKT